MKRTIVLIYGNVSYHVGNIAFMCLVGFTLNLVPVNDYLLIGIDSGAENDLISSLVINLCLIAIFGIQHSIMARSKFKQWLKNFIPEAAERSTYILATAIAVLILCLFWQPIPGVIWKIDNTFIYNILIGISLFGWALVVYSTFLINHYDLHGLRQVWLYYKGKEYTPLPFKLNSLYKYIRHPIMTGFFIGIWFTPIMTAGHLLFALAMSIYILIGVHHEERDLINALGEEYQQHMRKTAKFFPFY